MELSSTRTLRFNEPRTLYTVYTVYFVQGTVYASLNLSARVDKSSIYYCEYCTVTVHCTVYTVQ